MTHSYATPTYVTLAGTILATLAASGCAGPKSAPGQPPGGFPDLPAALRNTPGCLGVETARTSSGKNVIFAWFENKKAVENWYYSKLHRESMRTFFPGAGAGKPLEGIPDDAGPILTIASITFSQNPTFAETNLPISQIAIELYTPMKGGIFLGETFAPKGMKVPDMQNYTPAAAAASMK
ncbi:MAG: hypothetical protein DCC65_00885 [Planctomycetota bacterium]|nr:MAG: hypothetical protein DCC65_00885 [Planctomycetota bacterium]